MPPSSTPDQVAAALADVKRQILDEGTRVFGVIARARATTPYVVSGAGKVRPLEPQKDLFEELARVRSLMERKHALMLMQTYPESRVILQVELVSVMDADGIERRIPHLRVPDIGVELDGQLHLVEVKTEQTIVDSIARYGDAEMVAAYKHSSRLAKQLRREAQALGFARRNGVIAGVDGTNPVTGELEESVFDVTRIHGSRPQAYGIMGDIPRAEPVRPGPPRGRPAPHGGEPPKEPVHSKPAAPAAAEPEASRGTTAASRGTGDAAPATAQATGDGTHLNRGTTPGPGALEHVAEGAPSAFRKVAGALGAGALAGLKGALRGNLEGIAYEALAKLTLAPIGAAYHDAQIARASRGLRGGFIAGLSARVLARDGPWVREHLARNEDQWSMERSANADFVDAVGLEEHYYNVGLTLGYNHADQLPADFAGRLQDYVYDRMKAHNENFDGRTWDPSIDTIYRAGYYLQRYADPKLAKILEAARDAARAEAAQRLLQRGQAGLSGFSVHSQKQ